LWTGIDFLGEARGWPVRGSQAGLLDTAGFEKTGYYRRRALWTDKPVLYLVTAPQGEAETDRSPFYRSWNYRPGEAVIVTCYTNRRPVELFLNGKNLGPGEGDFPSWTLAFERGTLEARGPGLSDTLESTLPAVQFRLSRWEAARTRPPEDPPSAYRIIQVELELLDEKDRLCVQENPLVHFSLSGEGKILGIENGDLADLTEYRAPWRRVYQGHLIVYVLRPAAPKEGALLEASSAGGFPPVSIEL
jgi:hypothetical protein